MKKVKRYSTQRFYSLESLVMFLTSTIFKDPKCKKVYLFITESSENSYQLSSVCFQTLHFPGNSKSQRFWETFKATKSYHKVFAYDSQLTRFSRKTSNLVEKRFKSGWSKLFNFWSNSKNYTDKNLWKTFWYFCSEKFHVKPLCLEKMSSKIAQYLIRSSPNLKKVL